jgi:hypothetical protein
MKQVKEFLSEVNKAPLYAQENVFRRLLMKQNIDDRINLLKNFPATWQLEIFKIYTEAGGIYGNMYFDEDGNIKSDEIYILPLNGNVKWTAALLENAYKFDQNMEKLAPQERPVSFSIKDKLLSVIKDRNFGNSLLELDIQQNKFFYVMVAMNVGKEILFEKEFNNILKPVFFFGKQYKMIEAILNKIYYDEDTGVNLHDVVTSLWYKLDDDAKQELLNTISFKGHDKEHSLLARDILAGNHSLARFAALNKIGDLFKVVNDVASGFGKQQEMIDSIGITKDSWPKALEEVPGRRSEKSRYHFAERISQGGHYASKLKAESKGGKTYAGIMNNSEQKQGFRAEQLARREAAKSGNLCSNKAK